MCGCRAVGLFRREQLPFGCEANGCAVPAAGYGSLATGNKAAQQREIIFREREPWRGDHSAVIFQAASFYERGIIVATRL
jgi:hypothetical protein